MWPEKANQATWEGFFFFWFYNPGGHLDEVSMAISDYPPCAWVGDAIRRTTLGCSWWLAWEWDMFLGKGSCSRVRWARMSKINLDLPAAPRSAFHNLNPLLGLPFRFETDETESSLLPWSSFNRNEWDNYFTGPAKHGFELCLRDCCREIGDE